MTDRLNSLTVVLEEDMREDDATDLMQAIRQLRGVLSVQGNVTDTLACLAADQRIRRDLSEKLWKVLYPDVGAKKGRE